ncbi:MAG: phosphoribosylglycinamide formyltransferase [Thermoplasmata archaeon]|nr:phosphoribosylglycinamide formyltransferase [Thermoplasmata archaeon]
MTGPVARDLAVAVMVSGEGTTLEAVTEALAREGVAARVVAVVSNRSNALAVARAMRLGLAVETFTTRGRDPGGWADDVTEYLRSKDVDVVVLAGFLAILPARFVREWRGRVINLHPSLLPLYGGKGMFGVHVLEAVLRDGARETGATVHLVTERVDGGPVLLQRRIPVEPGDTAASLRQRLRPVEVSVLVEVLGHFADRSWPLPYDPDRPGTGGSGY